MEDSGNSAPASYATEVVPIGSLRAHPRNYRTHPQDQLAHIIESIKEHGVYRPVVVAKDGTILAGHGVVEAAKQLGMEEISVVRVPLAPNSPRALKLLAGDNEISRSAGVDDRALTDMLKEIMATDPAGLLGTGYDERQLAALAMVTRPQSEIPDLRAAAEWVGMPSFDDGGGEVALHVSFASTDARDQFIEGVLDGQTGAVRKTSGARDIWTMWWPPQEREHTLDVRVVQAKNAVADAIEGAAADLAAVDAAIAEAEP